LRFFRLSKSFFYDVRYLVMILLPGTLEQRLIRSVLNERMLEQIARLWRHPTLKHQFRLD